MPSESTRSELYNQQTGIYFFELVKITGADLSAPLRFANNTESIVANGELYEASTFDTLFPTGKIGGSSRLRFSISNIDRRPTEAVRRIRTRNPLTLTTWLIRADEPNAIELGPFEFTLRDVEWNAKTLSGTLYDDVDGGYSVPKHRYNSVNFPGLSGLT